jgi:hypothetical protein
MLPCFGTGGYYRIVCVYFLHVGWSVGLAVGPGEACMCVYVCIKRMTLACRDGGQGVVDP